MVFNPATEYNQCHLERSAGAIISYSVPLALRRTPYPVIMESLGLGCFMMLLSKHVTTQKGELFKSELEEGEGVISIVHKAN